MACVVERSSRSVRDHDELTNSSKKKRRDLRLTNAVVAVIAGGPGQPLGYAEHDHKMQILLVLFGSFVSPQQEQ